MAIWSKVQRCSFTPKHHCWREMATQKVYWYIQKEITFQSVKSNRTHLKVFVCHCSYNYNHPVVSFLSLLFLSKIFRCITLFQQIKSVCALFELSLSLRLAAARPRRVFQGPVCRMGHISAQPLCICSTVMSQI